MIVGKGWSDHDKSGLWVCSSAWCKKGIMRRLPKNALRVGGEIKERACMLCTLVGYPNPRVLS